jgi:anti-sigma-K factor RskA
MTERDHTRIEELFAAQALNGLDHDGLADLAEERATHEPDCPGCRELETSYQEVAGRLAFAVDPEQVQTGMVDEIVAAPRGPEQVGRVLRSPRAIGWRRSAAAIAAAAALVLAGGVGGYVVRGGAAAPQAVRLVSTGGSGSLAFVYQPEGRSGYLVGSGLAALPPDHVYELWVIRNDTPVPAGTFGAGEEQVVLPVRIDLSGATEIAVTVEPRPGSAAPTTKPVFGAPISV